MSTLKSKIDLLENNRSLGSSMLLNKAIEIFLTEKYDQEELIAAFNTLRKIDSSMIIVHHFLDCIEPYLDNRFRDNVLRYHNLWLEANTKIALRLKEYLPPFPLIILVHSNSGAITETLKILVNNGYVISVVQTKSLPGNEGSLQAQVLQHFGVNVSIIPDDKIDEAMRKVNCCLLGVDQYDDSHFVNKIGSKGIVESAKRHCKMVYILADSRKKVKKVQLSKSGLFEQVKLSENVKLITQ